MIVKFTFSFRLDGKDKAFGPKNHHFGSLLWNSQMNGFLDPGPLNIKISAHGKNGTAKRT